MSFPIAVLPPLRTPKSASALPATSSLARGGAPPSSPPGHAANGGGGVNFMSMGGFHATGTTDAPRRVRHAGAGAGGERVGEGGLGGVRGRYLRACSASARPASSGCGSGVRRSAAAGGGLSLHGREVPHSGAAFLLLPRRALAARARPRFRAARCPGTSTACSTTWDGRLGMVVVVAGGWVSAERSGLRGRRLPPRSRPASSRVGLVFYRQVHLLERRPAAGACRPGSGGSGPPRPTPCRPSRARPGRCCPQPPRGIPPASTPARTIWSRPPGRPRGRPAVPGPCIDGGPPRNASPSQSCPTSDRCPVRPAPSP